MYSHLANEFMYYALTYYQTCSGNGSLCVRLVE
uniref:Uncharacterized protein n=1 Tax=Anguilla anguilla TaxID=7936 RepID=A0A0E9TGN8_ANGAN